MQHALGPAQASSAPGGGLPGRGRPPIGDEGHGWPSGGCGPMAGAPPLPHMGDVEGGEAEGGEGEAESSSYESLSSYTVEAEAE